MTDDVRAANEEQGRGTIADPAVEESARLVGMTYDEPHLAAMARGEVEDLLVERGASLATGPEVEQMELKRIGVRQRWAMVKSSDTAPRADDRVERCTRRSAAARTRRDRQAGALGGAARVCRRRTGSSRRTG
jgi:hypothetical protein